VKAAITYLEAASAAEVAARSGGDAGAVVDAGTVPPEELVRSFRSQIIVQSEPAEAPIAIWMRRAGAAPFIAGRPNPGWEKVVTAVKTPLDVSLSAGAYHVVIDAFKDYKRSETDLELLPGRLYEFKANLSQGEFMGFLRVMSSASGARLFLDDPPPHKRPPWGRAPYGALVQTGEHTVWIEAPGYEPASAKVKVDHGDAVEITPALARVNYGYLRVDGNADEVTVRVDDAPRGVYTPVGEPLRLRLSAGPHRIEVSASGRKPYVGTIDVPAGQEMGVHGRLSYKPARGQAVATGALAVGAVVGGVALLQQAAQPQATGIGTPTGGASTHLPTYLRVGSGVSFGIGALLAVSTVYSLVSDPTPPSRLQLDSPKDFPDDEPADAPAGSRGRLFGREAASAAPTCGAL
jgi:hypothetical protein